MHTYLITSKRYLQNIRVFRKPVFLIGRFVRWIHHFRKNVQKEVDGIVYELDLNEWIDSSINLLGCFEPNVTHAITTLTRPGDVVVDVGANIGSHALRFAKLAGPTGKIVAFEPTAYAYRKIQRNMGLNPYISDSITLEKKVISNDIAEERTICFRSSWPIFGKQPAEIEEKVEVITLDEYVRLQGLQRINIIKIDVDGGETEVLEGAAETIKAHMPIIILELSSIPTLKKNVTFLVDLGYIFLTEQEYKPLLSTADIVASVDSEPIQFHGFKASTFIVIHKDNVSKQTLERLKTFH